MITQFRYTNAESAATYDFNSDIAPFTDFDVTIEERVDTTRHKMQQHGVWPTFPYRGGMEIHVEGDLLANDSSDYVSKRLTLMAALHDPTNVTPTVRRNGSLDIILAGMTEHIGADVSISAISGPITGGYPAYSKYLITFFCANPWFIGLTSGDHYYWS